MFCANNAAQPHGALQEALNLVYQLIAWEPRLKATRPTLWHIYLYLLPVSA